MPGAGRAHRPAASSARGWYSTRCTRAGRPCSSPLSPLHRRWSSTAPIIAIVLPSATIAPALAAPRFASCPCVSLGSPVVVGLQPELLAAYAAGRVRIPRMASRTVIAYRFSPGTPGSRSAACSSPIVHASAVSAPSRRSAHQPSPVPPVRVSRRLRPRRAIGVAPYAAASARPREYLLLRSLRKTRPAALARPALLARSSL